MKPEIWGKHIWNCIHIVTLSYPLKPTPKEKKNTKKFFDSLSQVLPCEKCRNNMTTHLGKLPLTDEVLSSRSSLVKWGIDFHNIVNYYTGKEMLTYNEALNHLNQLLKTDNSHSGFNTKYFMMALGFIMIVCVILYL